MPQQKMIEPKDDTTVTLPSDREIQITRTFRAPRKLVWEMWTTPEHLKNWLGPAKYEMTFCEIDLREGGKWQFAHRGPDGTEFTFAGVYREVRFPERIVQTSRFENMPGMAESLDTATFEEHDGITKVTLRVLHTSRESRDAHLSGGAMEAGVREGFNRLDEWLAKLA